MPTQDNIADAFVGNVQVVKIYAGTVIIYPTTPPPIALTIESTSSYNTQLIVSGHSVSLPAGTSSGDMLVMVVRASSPATISTPTDWSLVSSRTDTSFTYIFSKVSDGTEGATVTVTASQPSFLTAIVYRISGWTEGVEATFAGSNVNDPPSQTASWGSKRNLFIAVLTNNRSDSSVGTAPADYENLISVAQTPATQPSRVRVSTASRFIVSDNNDPGSFGTTGTITAPHSATIVIG
jgi:hypothetical protein